MQDTKMEIIFYHRLNKVSWLVRLALILIGSLFLYPGECDAKTKRIQNAEDFVSTIYNEISSVISKADNEPKKRKALLELFDQYADVPIIARAVLGRPWRTISANEKSRFVKAFRKYLAKKYTPQFSEFLGAKMMIEKSRDSKSKAGIMVETRFLMPGSTPIKVGWQVSNASGNYKMIDVKIEGVSLLTTERGEIRNQLSKEAGSVSKLSESLSKY